jgi:diaminopimelate epimerase
VSRGSGSGTAQILDTPDGDVPESGAGFTDSCTAALQALGVAAAALQALGAAPTPRGPG